MRSFVLIVLPYKREALLLIGRQVLTADGRFIDLLGIDADGVVHVLELKRDRTPREVVAQVLDYGSWVVGLGQEEIRTIFTSYRSDVEFDEAFAEHFGVESPPDELNTDHKLTVIASSVDPATERIVTYLATRYGVPVNVAFFRYFVDEGRSYWPGRGCSTMCRWPHLRRSTVKVGARNRGTARTGTSPSAMNRDHVPGRTHDATASSPQGVASGTPTPFVCCRSGPASSPASRKRATSASVSSRVRRDEPTPQC